MLKSSQIASKIQSLCDQKGWTYNVRNNILSISKPFTPHNMDELIDCDMEYYGILSVLPRCRAGSDWGTECGGVGAIQALNDGIFVMNRSGGNKNVLKLLAKASHPASKLLAKEI